MGVWIETQMSLFFQPIIIVTPCVGVWIETNVEDIRLHGLRSHPAWVCGLKLICKQRQHIDSLVTPCVGVWIETHTLCLF